MKHHNKTIGLIISKKNDNFIMQYVNDDGIYMISYEINNLDKTLKKEDNIKKNV